MSDELLFRRPSETRLMRSWEIGEINQGSPLLLAAAVWRCAVWGLIVPACRRRGERSQTVAKNSQVGRPEGRREAGRRPPPPTGRRWATHVFGNWQVTFDFAWGINSYCYFSATFGLENFSLKYYLVLIFYKAGLGKILLKVSPVRYFSTKDTSRDTVTYY